MCLSYSLCATSAIINHKLIHCKNKEKPECRLRTLSHMSHRTVALCSYQSHFGVMMGEGMGEGMGKGDGGGNRGGNRGGDRGRGW